MKDLYLIDKIKIIVKRYIIKRFFVTFIFCCLLSIQTLIIPNFGNLAITVHEGKLYLIPLMGLAVAVYIQFLFAELLIEITPYIYKLLKERINK